MSKVGTSRDYPCPAFATSGRCDEQDALRVMEQFKDFYEGKLNEIDVQGGGDCLELKLKIQKRWIDDLTEQTQMMARIVKELEDEATSRVRMLEDKLRQTSKSAYEKVFYLENDLKNLLEFLRRVRDDKKWSIDGLRFYDVTYKDLFGKGNSCDCEEKDVDPLTNGLSLKTKDAPPIEDTRKPENADDDNKTHEELIQMLNKKTDEYDELRRSMLDMRNALTEEVACKHDMISALKKDIQQLEERCVQADKQTAFKDDIIKELRKEIKHLKQQNKEKETNLEQQLEEAKTTIKRMKPNKEVVSTSTEMEDEQLVIKKSKLMQNKDDIIQIQNDTLNVIDLELQAARKREKDAEDEIGRKQNEIEELKCRCLNLEKSLASAQGRADNLQKAVDLYINSINVLEASEEKAKIEIEQQKMTITNLQEALVIVKQELDELRQNNQQEVEHYQYLCNVFYVNLIDLEEQNKIAEHERSQITDLYKKLQDCSLELEIDHFNVLQDLAILETQLYKYQAESKAHEDEKLAAREESKKLHKQIRYYEHVVDCFKHEMTVMSEQLINLQEILKLSNQSCREENGQLYAAIHELQKLSEKLQAELVDTEKKVLIENQKNQLKDAKIGELQLIIGQKNVDLNIHDEAINEMKMRLEKALMENQELQNTVAALNTNVTQLQCWNGDIECTRKSSRSRGVSCRRSHSECRDECQKTSKRVDYLERQDTSKMIQKEIDRVKEKNREKIRSLKRQNEDLKEKLATSELTNQRFAEQLTSLREQMSQLTQRECSREQELVQSKQTIIELRQTMIELNESLAESELHHMALAEEYHKNKTNENRQQEDIYLSCRCEIALYKKLADNFKEALLDTKKKLSEMEVRNKSLKEELKNKDAKITEIVKRSGRKEQESCECIELMKEELKEAREEEKRLSILTEQLQNELTASHEEEKRLSKFIEDLKQQVQKKIEEKKDVERVIINCCDCNDMGATQEEINCLKVEIKSMLQNQLALNTENDKLLKQLGCLQTNVLSLEDQNHHLKQKFQKLQDDCQKLKEKNMILLQERDSYVQTIKNLEFELAEAKNNRDDLCAESRHVVNNVKAWLQEQRRINQKVMQRTRCYCDTIAKLKEENENLMTGRPLITPTSCKPKYERLIAACVPAEYQTCQNPCCLGFSLGSEGIGSVDISPPNSPASCICSVEDWYSPNYKDDDETDDNEHFIDTVEAITHEIKNSNKKWKNKCQECVVSRDNK
ncbi:golgin subfamily A member 6-like protein 24 isoform X2 [Zophobas morio]|uniref:golgin subfamily A member 6-like protein 24 isoform X2 n=1 Tax=Zophobas morio TaxID=2755281 RepID=UPI00308344C4